MKINKDEDIVEYCKKCNIEVNYIDAYIESGYECPKCKENNYLPSGKLEIIKYLKTTLTIETLEPLKLTD